MEHCTSSIVECISKLPANLSIVKSLTRGDSSQQSDLLTGETSSTREKFDWGALLSQWFNSYWQCVLFTLKRLHRGCAVSPIPSSEDTHSEQSPSALTLPVDSCDVCALARVCLDNLDIAGEAVATVIECFSLLVPKVFC